MDLMTRRGLIGAKNQSGSRLPKQYQEIEYIRSTGSQFINISDEYNQYEYSAVAAFMTTRNQYACLCGWSDDAYVNANIGYSGKMTVYRSNGRNTSKSASVTSADYIGQKLKFDCFKNYARISNPDTGVVLAENTDYFELIESPVWLFHCDSSDNKAYMRTRYVNAKLYGFKVYLSGGLIHDLVPCYRKSDNKPGMYDLVSGAFFVNAGTGEFTVGPDVIDSISPWLVARRRMLMVPVNVLSSLPEGVKIYLSETVGDVVENVPYIYLGLDDNGNARLLREKTAKKRKYANGNSPDYATTLIDAWLENTVDGFLSRFDENVISSLVNTEIKYVNYSQNSSGEISSASRRCFLMSKTEVGFSQTSVGNEGKSFLNALKTYFNTTDSNTARVSKQDENAVSYWLRSAQNTAQMALVWSDGTSNRYGASYAGYYVRPALSLKADTRAKVKNGEYYI